jgi:hypothetical protein
LGHVLAMQLDGQQYVTILLGVLCAVTSVAMAKDRGATRPAPVDFYQMSVQATDCKVTVLINGVANQDFSLNARHGGAVSGPLYQKDLKPTNTITLQLADTTPETTVSLNVSGAIGEDQIVSTDQPGNVLALVLDGKQIAASKTKRFSGQFVASFRKPEPKPNLELVSEDEAKAYAKYFAGLLRSKNRDKLFEELLPLAQKSPKSKGLSVAELREKFNSEMAELLDNSVFLADKGTPIEVKAKTSKLRATYEVRVKGGNGLVQFHETKDGEKKLHDILVVIEKVGGKIQIAELGIQ